jgi:hypothetical protein
VEEGSAGVWAGELPFEVILPDRVKKVWSGEGDILRRDALKRADRWGCGRVISCSRDQERWRTKLELCRCESFNDRHRPAAFGTAPQRVHGGGRRGFGVDLR